MKVNRACVEIQPEEDA